jgi:hypothetical protein
MSSQADRWIVVIMVCLMTLGIRRAAAEVPGPLGYGLGYLAFPVLILFSLTLAVLSSLGWID